MAIHIFSFPSFLVATIVNLIYYGHEVYFIKKNLLNKKKNRVCKQKRILPALLAMKIFFQSQKQQKVENISNELMSSQ